MDVTGPDNDWRSQGFRQKVVTQIEDAMRKAGTAHNKSSNDMENHVFNKAKSREEYLSMVARLIIHFRDIHQMNPLQNLTAVGGAGGPGTIGLPPRPPGAPIAAMGAMNQMQIGQHTMQGVAGSQQGMMPRAGIQMPPRLPRAIPNSAIPPNPAAMGGQQVPQPQQMSSPSPVQAQTPQPSMPPPAQPQPSPQSISLQLNSVSSGPTPSPGGFQPSPSPQPSQSPATARTPLQVPSPGPLSTPGNPSSVMSPLSVSQSEDQLYMDKLKQLSKYIEPLRRMINKIDKNEERKKDLSKMKSLLNILTDPNTRCPLKTLQKCEIALEKLKNDMAVPTPPPPTVPSKKQYLCQPLLDAVLANIRSPVFNHSLYRTFAPAMTAIHGPPISGPIIPTRKRKYEEDDRQTIPNILQGEVARLDSKFLVNLDPSFCSNNGTVHLICKLDDKTIPSVPPLQLSIPSDYPEQSPQWDNEDQNYEANLFLQNVYRNMTSKLLQLPDKHSVTALLNTWAESVRLACLTAA
ncbi:Mediator of RNA polymerase II transcription subunit 15 [Bagarius yarrelli]|uniref:Mediator of RNA polymerase II transcription subunit 15 n=1 Tax=Bagarius yarrelli TaxID=175774 RepID=A0A556TWY9_BAGYA|nr:Mediator of RNA polymerase II transcription subunit 15 [Bagarius yarrelli]